MTQFCLLFTPQPTHLFQKNPINFLSGRKNSRSQCHFIESLWLKFGVLDYFFPKQFSCVFCFSLFSFNSKSIPVASVCVCVDINALTLFSINLISFCFRFHSVSFVQIRGKSWPNKKSDTDWKTREKSKLLVNLSHECHWKHQKLNGRTLFCVSLSFDWNAAWNIH